jgi:hypothetical protein
MTSLSPSSDYEVFSIKEFFESLQENNTDIPDIPDQNNRSVESKNLKIQILLI